MNVLEKMEGNELEYWYAKHKNIALKKILNSDLINRTENYHIRIGSGLF